MPSTYFQFHSLLQNSVIFFLKKHIFSIQLIFLIFWDIESNMMWNMSWFHLPYPFACISVVVHRSPWIWLWFSIRKTNIIKITFKFLLFAIKVRWTCFWNVKSHMCPMYLPNAWYPTVRVWLVNYLSCIWCLDLFKLDSWVDACKEKNSINYFGRDSVSWISFTNYFVFIYQKGSILTLLLNFTKSVLPKWDNVTTIRVHDVESITKVNIEQKAFIKQLFKQIFRYY